MQYPNINEEKKLWKQGFEVVVGLDEVGRGPLAGPVIAAAVAVRQIPGTSLRLAPPNHKHQIPKVNDSKKLSERQREELYEILTHHPNIVWGIGEVSEKVIDKINILEASKLAMQKALDDLGFKIYDLRMDYLLIDGNFTLNEAAFAKSSGAPKQKSIIKGDSKVFSIAAASIIAKVTRDRLMQKMHKKYPNYGFDKHKGYGTAAHIANLTSFGPCKIHRRSFYPVTTFIK